MLAVTLLGGEGRVRCLVPCVLMLVFECCFACILLFCSSLNPHALAGFSRSHCCILELVLLVVFLCSILYLHLWLYIPYFRSCYFLSFIPVSSYSSQCPHTYKLSRYSYVLFHEVPRICFTYGRIPEVRSHGLEESACAGGAHESWKGDAPF